MEAHLFRVILPVSDIEAAASFFAAVLGDPGRRVSPGRHYFDCGGTLLACFDPHADGDAYDPAPLVEPLYFAVSDLETTLTAVQDAAAREAAGRVHGMRANEIAVRPWGERSFYTTDPFGNPLCFVDAGTVFTGAD